MPAKKEKEKKQQHIKEKNKAEKIDIKRNN